MLTICYARAVWTKPGTIPEGDRCLGTSGTRGFRPGTSLNSLLTALNMASCHEFSS